MDTALTYTAQAVAPASEPLRILLAVLASYLLGSIPTAYIAGRLLRGIDIRTQGSGNVGATNVFRVLGPKPGAAVLAIDMAKGALAVTAVPALFGLVPNHWDTLACGLVAVLGHDFTVFLRFKGGKGVATSCGVFLGLEPVATVLALAVFAGTVWSSRMISLGSLLAAASLPLFIFLVPTSKGEIGNRHWVLYLALLLVVVLWVKHIPNIKRILAGTESKFNPKGGEAKKEEGNG